MARATDSVRDRLVFKSGMLYFAAEMLTRGCSFLMTPIFTRLLPPGVFADAKVFESWCYLIAPVISLSVYQSIPRARLDYREKLDQYLSSVITLMVALTAFALVITFALGSWIPALPVAVMLVFSLAYNGIQTVQTYDRQTMNYRRNVFLTVMGTVPGALLSVGLIVIFRSRVSEDTLLVLRILGFSLPVVIVGLTVMIRQLIRYGVHPNVKWWAYAVQQSVPLIFSVAASQVFLQFGSILTRNLIGAEAAAVVVVAMTVGYIVDILTHAIDNAWKPWMFEKLDSGENVEVRRVWRSLLAILSVITVMGTLFAPELVLFLGGRQYSQATGLVFWILCGSMANFIAIGYTSLEMYKKKTRVSIYTSVIAVTAYFALGIVFIRMDGLRAAAYVLCASYLVNGLLHHLFCRGFNKEDLLQFRFCILLIGSVIVLCWGMTRLYGLPFLARCGIGMVVLLGFLWAFRNRFAQILRLIKKNSDV